MAREPDGLSGATVGLRAVHGVAAWRGRLARRFELGRGGADDNLPPMEGLRGLAVFLVFLAHFVTPASAWLPAGSALRPVAIVVHEVGKVGVDLFFVLSGYLIYGLLMARPQPYRQFLRRRMVRIYPAFLAVFALYLGLSLLMSSGGKLPAGLPEAIGYLVANLLFLPGLLPIEPLIAVAWSLSYEWAFYLTVPLLVARPGWRQRPARWRLACLLAFAAAALLLSAVAGGPVRLLMFVSGTVLWERLREAPGRPLHGAGAFGALAALAGLAVAAWPAPGEAMQALKFGAIAVLFGMLCHDAFVRDGNRLARALAWTPLRWLGNMSYSYYLIHGLAVKGLFVLLGRLASPWAHASDLVFLLLLPLAFAVSCAVAAALFLLVERPLSLVAPRRAAPHPAGSQPTPTTKAPAP